MVLMRSKGLAITHGDHVTLGNLHVQDGRADTAIFNVWAEVEKYKIENPKNLQKKRQESNLGTTGKPHSNPFVMVTAAHKHQWGDSWKGAFSMNPESHGSACHASAL